MAFVLVRATGRPRHDDGYRRDAGGSALPRLAGRYGTGSRAGEAALGKHRGTAGLDAQHPEEQRQRNESVRPDGTHEPAGPARSQR